MKKTGTTVRDKSNIMLDIAANDVKNRKMNSNKSNFQYDLSIFLFNIERKML